MTEQESLETAIHEHTELVSYETDWPNRCEAEHTWLLYLSPGDLVELLNFGSTAIPGPGAKPIIDIL
jgi:GrpB-like predicted nucleotidyltransferase (UPF0157 family)